MCWKASTPHLIRSFPSQHGWCGTSERTYCEMMSALAWKQNNLEETNKIYTGSHKDRRNSCKHYEFIFLLFLYVFLTWDVIFLLFINIYIEICCLIVYVEINCISHFFFFCLDDDVGFSLSFRPVVFNQGRFCPLRNSFNVSRHFWLWQLGTVYMLRASSGQRPAKLPNSPQCTGWHAKQETLRCS